jgi:hypothetical protein
MAAAACSISNNYCKCCHVLAQMRTVAAFLLCVLGGNATPSADDVSKVITAVGGEADADSISKLLKDMEGKVECLSTLI